MQLSERYTEHLLTSETPLLTDLQQLENGLLVAHYGLPPELHNAADVAFRAELKHRKPERYSGHDRRTHPSSCAYIARYIVGLDFDGQMEALDHDAVEGGATIEDLLAAGHSEESADRTLKLAHFGDIDTYRDPYLTDIKDDERLAVVKAIDMFVNSKVWPFSQEVKARYPRKDTKTNIWDEEFPLLVAASGIEDLHERLMDNVETIQNKDNEAQEILTLFRAAHPNTAVA